MCIGAQEGASGSAALRRAAPPHRPFALVGLRATSHTCDSLYAIAVKCLLDIIIVPLDVITVLRYYSIR